MRHALVRRPQGATRRLEEHAGGSSEVALVELSKIEQAALVSEFALRPFSRSISLRLRSVMFSTVPSK